jgi:glycosyltransferase involved in cell wall biosynthesis
VPLNGSIGGIDARERFRPQPGGEDRRAIRGELGIDHAAPVIGFVGRIVADKGIEILASAWQRLARDFPTARLLLVGTEEARDDRLAPVLARLREDPRVHFTGWRSDTERWYRAMDLLLLPSFREGLGMVLLEAGAVGLPVVASAIPGCVDAVVDGVTGRLVAPGRADALAAAAAEYLRDEKLSAEHGAAARARVLELFRPEPYAEHLTATYRALIAGSAAQPFLPQTFSSRASRPQRQR